ncbi:MAG: YrdB family protein [Anaerolineae bacterium]|jgi:hypothetical protein
MSLHPLNLAVRFLLEIAALVAIGYWGFYEHTGMLKFALGIGLPLFAAAVWATFRVPGDRSASGNAPVAVPGLVRLLLELALFALAAWALYDAGRTVLALLLSSVTMVHYIVSYDRIAWLVQRRGTEMD